MTMKPTRTKKWLAGILAALMLGAVGVGSSIPAFAAESSLGSTNSTGTSGKATSKATPIVADQKKTGDKVGETIRQMQANLNELGYACGEPDGCLNEATIAQINKFQEASGLEIDGKADTETWKAVAAAVKQQRQRIAQEQAAAEALAAQQAAEAARLAEEQRQARLAAASSIPADIWLVQNLSDNCTISSITILLRAQAYLQGEDYTGITINDVMSVGWCSAGALFSFSYNGCSVRHSTLSGSGADREAEVYALLAEHPEGLVLYGYGASDGVYHAAYANLSETGEIQYLDPAMNSYANRYLAFGTGWGASLGDWNYIQEYWYLA